MSEVLQRNRQLGVLEIRAPTLATGKLFLLFKRQLGVLEIRAPTLAGYHLSQRIGLEPQKDSVAKMIGSWTFGQSQDAEATDSDWDSFKLINWDSFELIGI